MDKLYSTIYKFLIVAGCALIAGFISYICLTYIYSRITSRIYIRMFNCKYYFILLLIYQNFEFIYKILYLIDNYVIIHYNKFYI